MNPMVFDFSVNPSILNNYISELRDVTVQQDKMRFRTNLERISEIMAYEISKKLNFEDKEVQTPLGVAKCSVMNSSIVIGSILRAGLPMHNGFLKIFDKGENAFISAYRSHHKDGTFDIRLEYMTCPHLSKKVFILVDPMLATGSSIEKTLIQIKEYGKPAQIHVATAIASTQGISHLRRLFPKVYIWAGAIDEELTAKSYIVPGLGDAGDLAFGSKLQD